MYDSLFLSDVEQGTEFRLVGGQSIKNIYELVGALKGLSKENFSYHCNTDKDDFGAWISDSLHNSMIANILSRVKDQNKYVRIIEKAIHHKELESQARLHVVKVSRLWIENNKKKLSEMHNTLREYEKKFLEREKQADMFIAASVEKHVEEFLSGHRVKLRQEIEKTTSTILDLEKKYEEELKSKEDQFDKTITEHASNAVSKFADEIVAKHKQEFVEIMGNEKSEASKEIQATVHKELSGIVDKQKEMIQSELAMTFEKRKEMEKALEESVTKKEEELIKKITDHSEKELFNKLAKQREMLDNELTKSIKSNKFFLEKFEEEIRNKEKRLTETINSAVDKQLSKDIEKHQKELDAAISKGVESLKVTQKQCDSMMLDKHPELINDASEKIRSNVIKYFEEQRALINTEVKKQLNSHVQDALVQHKELLGKELNNAILDTKQITKNVEDKLHDKTVEIAALAEELVSKALDKKLDKTLDKHKSNLASESEKVIDFISQKQKEHEEHLSLKEEELKKIVEDAVVEAVDENVRTIIDEHKQNLDEEFDKVNSLHKDLEDRYYHAVEEKGEKIASNVQKKTESQLQNVIDKKTVILEKELDKIRNLMSSIVQQKKDLLNEKNKILIDIKQAADNKVSSKILEMEKRAAKYKVEIRELEKETAEYKGKIKNLESESKESNKKINALENKLKELAARKPIIIEKKIKESKSSKNRPIVQKQQTKAKEQKEKTKEENALQTKEPKAKPVNNVILKIKKDESKPKKRFNNTEKKIYNLVNQCEDSLRNGKYDKVKGLYHEIVELYKKGDYDPEDKLELYSAIKAVYDEIWQYAQKSNNSVQMSQNQ
jgi:hypothetical protein